MSSVWGRNLKISIFGESHGKGIGIVIDGLPAGFALDFERILFHMRRRSPGKDDFSTARKEDDIPEILSGYYNGFTTGTPLCAVIKNTNENSKDYEHLKIRPRPGHADFTGNIKYSGFNDPRGGGHFSGRLTAPLVFAGAIAMQMLEKKGIFIGAHVQEISGKTDEKFDPLFVSKEDLEKIMNKDFPVISDEAGQKMKEEILMAKNEGDSVGGIIECAVIGLMAGIGNPIFNSIESEIAAMMFSIPAVKGVEFGSGFELAKMKGSQSNDCFCVKENRIVTKTNNCGGILGGISNGMPIIFRVAIKPTPSVFVEQETVDLEKMGNSKLIIKGRHDPCIVQRAVPVIETAASLVILDFMLEKLN